MKALLRTTVVAAALAAGAFSVSVPATAGPGAQIGILNCKTVPGTRVNMLIHSTVGLSCTFDTPSGSERYKGESGIGLGLDLNWNRQERIAFAVIAGTVDYEIGSHGLAGKFVGAKASATIGYGAGAAVLIGGGERNITLQPLALEASSGLGVSAGIGYLFLAPDV